MPKTKPHSTRGPTVDAKTLTQATNRFALVGVARRELFTHPAVGRVVLGGGVCVGGATRLKGAKVDHLARRVVDGAQTIGKPTRVVANITHPGRAVGQVEAEGVRHDGYPKARGVVDVAPVVGLVGTLGAPHSVPLVILPLANITHTRVPQVGSVAIPCAPRSWP